MNNFTDTVCVVIVLYKIALEESPSFKSVLAAQKLGKEISVFIYDNSPYPQETKNYPDLHFFYTHDPENPGVSKAYNSGAAYAHRNEKEWILILDQDTTLPEAIFLDYERAIRKYPEIKLFAPILKLANGKIFSPCKYRFKRGFHLKGVTAGLSSFKNMSPVNSGMLINTTSFFEAGGYNNAVKLDFSDFQFIERFRKVQSNWCIIDVVCEQDFSDDEVSFASQLNRFRYYCEGALHSSKDGMWDWLQYGIVVFIRGTRLTLRYKRLDFFGTYVNFFLINSFSGAK